MLIHSRLLGELEILPRQVQQGLEVFGLRGSRSIALSYLTLDEALLQGTVEITEASEVGSVPFLRLVNLADTNVFLLAGEELVGAKQNRVINTSLLVGPKTATQIPVSCVEARRWRYTSRKFESRGSSSHSTLRRHMSAQISRSYRSTGSAGSDQAAVWKEVQRKLTSSSSKSPSLALHQVHEDFAERLRAFLENLKPPEDWSGAAFGIDGRLAGVELFDQPSTITRLWPKLLRSYAIDALETTGEFPPLSRAQVADWLATVDGTDRESFAAVGLGVDIRLSGPNLVGSTLVVDAVPVHTALFAK